MCSRRWALGQIASSPQPYEVGNSFQSCVTDGETESLWDEVIHSGSYSKYVAVQGFKPGQRPMHVASHASAPCLHTASFLFQAWNRVGAPWMFSESTAWKTFYLLFPLVCFLLKPGNVPDGSTLLAKSTFFLPFNYGTWFQELAFLIPSPLPPLLFLGESRDFSGIPVF